MADALVTKFKQQIAGLTMVPASGGCFEVTVNDTLVYSKLETGQFPNESELVDAIANSATA